MSNLATKSNKKPLSEGRVFAESVVRKLAPHCEKIEIAGSIRRQSKEVSDIEIVCQPKAEYDLFEKPIRHIQAFLDAINSPLFRCTDNCIGIENNAKYFRRQIPGFQVDIFTATPTNWGWIFLLRTGSSEFNQNLLREFKKHELVAENGYLYQDRTLVEVVNEKIIFDMLKLKYVEPQDR
jgi:DNA polymerase/3'-5' exonuclease PolX